MKWTQVVVLAGLTAGLVPVAASASDRPAGAVDTVAARPIFHDTDRATGAAIRVFRHDAGAATVEVTTPDLVVRKAVAPGLAVTRLTGRDEDLSVAIDTTGLISVTDHRAGLTARGTTTDNLRLARGRLQRSAVAHAAASLLGRMDLSAPTPVNATLRGSHVLIASAVVPAANRVARLVPVTNSRPLSAGLGGAISDDDQTMRMTANDCWTEYTKEAIAAWIEYEQCVDSEQWWDVFGMGGCLAIYEMRAIGAFSVWAACVSLRG